MTLPRPDATGRWPITPEAWSALVAEIDRLEEEVAGIRRERVVGLPSADAARRLRTLTLLRDDAMLAEPAVVAIGRRVTIREADGTTESYAICLPGDGDPTNGWISADSPLAAAVLGHAQGTRVGVVAPMGVRQVEVVGVGDP